MATKRSDMSRDVREVLPQLFAKSAKGTRACVPVFGTGLNIQAATMAGHSDVDDWAQLLENIGARIGLSREALARFPTNHLALWEAMLCKWARHNEVFASEAERLLQKYVCELLREREKKTSALKLYRDVAAAGFSDVISLNFDRRIAMSMKQSKFVTGPRNSPLGTYGESFFRHSLIEQRNGATTRIWYPHGDVKKTSTVKLGARRYGFYIAVFREYLEGLGGAWRYKPRRNQEGGGKSPTRHDLENPNWVDLFFNRPLVFIGCSLAADEWPLWWLLHERGIATGGKIPTYYLTFGGRSREEEYGHFDLLPDMRIVSFETPQELWCSFSSWISDDPKQAGP